MRWCVSSSSSSASVACVCCHGQHRHEMTIWTMMTRHCRCTLFVVLCLCRSGCHIRQQCLSSSFVRCLCCGIVLLEPHILPHMSGQLIAAPQRHCTCTAPAAFGGSAASPPPQTATSEPAQRLHLSPRGLDSAALQTACGTLGRQLLAHCGLHGSVESVVWERERRRAKQ